MKIVRVKDIWQDEVEIWLDNNVSKWLWYTKETCIPYRIEHLIWNDEDALAFTLAFGDKIC